MSLQSLQFISNITAPGKDSLLVDLQSQASAGRNIVFRNDINAAVFYPVTTSSDASRFWDRVLIDTDRLLLGIGTGSDEPPTGGTWDGSYDGDPSGLSDLAYNITAGNLQTALNTNTTIHAAGDVEVELIGTGIYQATFNTNGARELIAGNPAGLSPQSNVFVSRYVTGDAETKEVQIIQLVQRPYVYVTSWSLTPDPTAVLTVITNGTADPGGTSASYLITLTGELYDGTFTLTLDGQDYAIPYNAQATTFTGIIGSGWTVSQVSGKQWAIQAAAVGVHSAAVDGANLIAYVGLIGTLGFNATSLLLAFLQSGEDEIEAKLQVRYVNSTIERDTLLFVPVTITRDVLSAAAIAPTNWNQFYYTAAQVDALIAILRGYSSGSTSSAETIELTRTAPQTITDTFTLTVGAGVGSYTTAIELSTADCSAGDIWRIQLNMPSSSNPTITVDSVVPYNISGTGDAFTLLLAFTFNGTAWESNQ
jgi:hypothetical protein